MLQVLSHQLFPREQAISLTRWRPKSVEIKAIQQVITLAKQIMAPIHVVHVSTLEGAKGIAEAKEAGVPMSCETCPQYLFFKTF